MFDLYSTGNTSCSFAALCTGDDPGVESVGYGRSNERCVIPKIRSQENEMTAGPEYARELRVHGLGIRYVLHDASGHDQID